MFDYIVPIGIVLLLALYGKDIFNFLKSKFVKDVTQKVDNEPIKLPAPTPVPAPPKVNGISALHGVLASLDKQKDAKKIKFLINNVGPSLLAPEDLKDFVNDEKTNS